jgi:hypothetical protein
MNLPIHVRTFSLVRTGGARLDMVITSARKGPLQAMQRRSKGLE